MPSPLPHLRGLMPLTATSHQPLQSFMTKAPLDMVPRPRMPSSFRRVLQIENHYINDHCLVQADGKVHAFYILGEVGKGCYTPGNECVIGHSVSEDLAHWTEAPAAVTCDPDHSWESAHVFAPYIIRESGRYYLFYSSDNAEGAQYLNLATSDDLDTWVRHPANPILTPPEWALWDSGIGCSCRDAHVIQSDEFGYLLYYVADLPEEPPQSCIAVARSRDLVHWEASVPVLSRRHSELEAFVCKTESPCVVERNGLYYLFYRHGNGTKFAVSSTPLSWQGCDSYLLGPTHASEILELDGQWMATSCSRPIEDLAHQYDRTDGLWIGSLRWQGNWPELV